MHLTSKLFRPVKILAIAMIFTALTFYAAGCKKHQLTSLGRNGKDVGASSNDLLSDSKYKSLEIQVLYMPGYQPDTNSINNLVAFLQQLLHKPNGITVSYKGINASGKSSLSLDEVKNIESDNRTVFNKDDKIGTCLLFTDGSYTGQSNVLGVAYLNTSMCIFGKTIADNSGGLSKPSKLKLESTVIEHEFGHIMGLVNLGCNMMQSHMDGAHGNHCSNNNCLMYYASETTDILGFLISGNVPTLDVNCRADLTGNGGK